MPSPKPRPSALLVSLVLTALLVSEATALRPHVREGWHLGVAYGAAAGDFDGPAGERLEFEDGVSPQIRAGRMVASGVGLGLAYAGWLYETGAMPIKQRYSMHNLLLSASWYPGRPATPLGGLCVRLGFGLGWVGYAEVEIREEEEQGHGDRVEFSGPALELNLSYEFRLTRTVAAGVGVGVNSTGLDNELESATFVPVTANLSWYWD